jgi:hypothetical protein
MNVAAHRPQTLNAKFDLNSRLKLCMLAPYSSNPRSFKIY